MIFVENQTKNSKNGQILWHKENIFYALNSRILIQDKNGENLENFPKYTRQLQEIILPQFPIRRISKIIAY